MAHDMTRAAAHNLTQQKIHKKGLLHDTTKVQSHLHYSKIFTAESTDLTGTTYIGGGFIHTIFIITNKLAGLLSTSSY